MGAPRALLPSIDPANFVRRIDNRYFPLKPGTRFHYEGFKGKTPQRDNMVVTHRKMMILGIRSTVVRDTVSQHGKPIERTFDWYAQDKHGNVWYMGENSLELHHGRFVRASDSWKSGVDGGLRIIMEAHLGMGTPTGRSSSHPVGRSTRRTFADIAEADSAGRDLSESRSSPSSGARWNHSWRRRTTRPD